MEYTGAQRAAIGTLDEPLLIVACAGSGKTQVISERIVEILRLPGVEPKNIVAFTFTEKAAAELKERVTVADHGGVPRDDGARRAVHRDHARVRPGSAADLRAAHVQAERARRTSRRGCSSTGNSRASGLTVTDAVVNGVPKKLKRFVNSPLWMQVLGILREDDVDETLLPALADRRA